MTGKFEYDIGDEVYYTTLEWEPDELAIGGKAILTGFIFDNHEQFWAKIKDIYTGEIKEVLYCNLAACGHDFYKDFQECAAEFSRKGSIQFCQEFDQDYGFKDESKKIIKPKNS